MKRALSMVLAAAMAATPAGIAAEAGPRDSQPRLSPESITRALRVIRVDAHLDPLKDSVPRAGQPRTGSWDSLASTVQRGRAVRVTLADSTHVQGRLLVIDGRSITVEQPGGPRVIDSADVLRVQYASTRKRHVIRGMLIGMVAGAAATTFVDRRSSHPSSVAEAAGLGAIAIGLPVGALVGALVPSGPLLYEAAPVLRKRP